MPPDDVALRVCRIGCRQKPINRLSPDELTLRTFGCRQTDDVVLSDGTSNAQAMIEAIEAITAAESESESTPFPVFRGNFD